MKEKSSHNNADTPDSQTKCNSSSRPSTAPTVLDGRVGEASTNERNFLTQTENLSSLSVSSSNLPSVEYSSKDDGKPTSNMHRDVLRTLKLVRQERHLLADDLYQSVKARMESYKAKLAHGGGKVKSSENETHEAAQNYTAASHAIDRQIEEFEKLEHRARLFRRVKRNLSRNDDWILSHQTSCGLKTYYRREADKSLSIKMEGELNEAPVFEQIAVTREIDLYHHWAPLCTDSKKLGVGGRLDVLAWQKIGAFGLVRDVCYRAIGCDSLAEDGCFFITARGLSDDDNGTNENNTGNLQSNLNMRFQPVPSDGDEEQYEKYLNSYFERDSILNAIELPPKPTGFGAARMQLRKFECTIQVISPQSARTCMISNIVPGFSLLPQSLIDFCMKKICGIMLLKLQVAALNAVTNPQDSVHAQRMREDSQFYKEWCMPKVKQYCDLMGWEIPSIKAFDAESAKRGDEIADNSVHNYDSDGSAGENMSVKTLPTKMPPLGSSLRASIMPENLLRSASKKFSIDQINRMRQIKEMLREPADISESIRDITGSNHLILKFMNSFWDKVQETCNGIPQHYMIPFLFAIVAIVIPANFQKHLVHDDPETYVAYIISNLMSSFVAVLALVVLIVVHCTVITIALVSVFNDNELLNRGMENTKHLLIFKIRYFTACLSGSTAAYAFFKAMAVVISRALYRQFCIICAKVDSVWSPIKMIGAPDRNIVAIFAEWVERVVYIPFRALSSLFSPVFHRMGFISRAIGHTIPNNERYFFWKNVVHTTQVVMLYTGVFLLISIGLALKLVASISVNDPDTDSVSQEETSPKRGNLYKIEENTASIDEIASPVSLKKNRSLLTARGTAIDDEVSTISHRSNKSKSPRKKVKNMFKKLKKKKKKQHDSTEDEVARIPSPITVRTHE